MLSCHDKVPTGFVFVQKFKTDVHMQNDVCSGDKKPGGCAVMKSGRIAAWK